MKLRVILTVLLMNISLFSQSLFNELHSLHEKKHIFEFASGLKAGGITGTELRILEALERNLFNDPESSNRIINELLSDNPGNIPDSLMLQLLEAKLQNEVNLYDYSSAYSTSELILSKYKSLLDSTEEWETNNSHTIWKAALDIKPQTAEFIKDSKLDASRDLAGLMNVKVSVAGEEADFVFDTGANFTVVNKSYAGKLKLKYLSGKFKVGAITGNKVDSELAYAPEMKIGNIIFKNVLFLVLPDEILSFAGGLYIIKGIVGFPVIKQMKEVHFRNDELFIPVKSAEKKLGNFALDGFVPVINVIYKNDSLAFTFDTGARHTILYLPFLEKFRKEIESKYTLEEIEIGGAGGTKTVKGYKIDKIKLMIGGATATIEDVKLVAEPILKHSDQYYGNLGQDFFKQFGEMTLNFESMYAEFGK